MKKIVIIILHYGNVSITKSCIQGLEKHETYPYQLIVVNNTQKKLIAKQVSNKKVIVINNKENKGFAGGVNVGIQEALKNKFDAVLLLNNDTSIEKSFLKKLVELLYSKKEIGIVGPSIQFLKNKKRIFDIGGFVNWFGKTCHEELSSTKNVLPYEVTYVTGAAMLIKKEVLDTVGLLDETFFLYYEDVDFCLRARIKSFKIYCNPHVSVSHSLSKTAGKMSPLAVYHQTKSALIFGRKYMKNPISNFANKTFIFLQTLLFCKINLSAGIAGFRAIKDYYSNQENFPTGLLIISISILTLISFWRVLFFDFWIDDWYLIWTSLYNFPAGHWYFNHPGLPLEFYVLSHVFGLHVLYWQIVNLLLKIIVSYLIGVFVFQLTNSRKTQFLSSLYFAASYLGFEAISSPIMNVAALASIPMLLSLIYFMHAIKENIKLIRISLTCLFIAFVLDPARMVPLVIVFPGLIYLLGKHKNTQLILNNTKKYLVILLIIGIPLFILWFWHFESNSQIGHVLEDLFSHNLSVLAKINRIGNLFTTIGNMWTGLFYPLPQDAQNTGVYMRWIGWIGILFLLIGMWTFLKFMTTKSKRMGIISFFIVWIFLFYIPNWFSEPRAPMAGPHRYLFISSIGFCCLIAYVFVQFKNKWLVIILSVLFISLNIFQANRILAWQSTYRSKTIVENIWNTVVRDVKFDNKQTIFVFYGQEPWLHQIVDLSAASPFMLKKHLGAYTPAPIFTRDPNVILSYLCSSSTQNRVTFSDVYAWYITYGGGIENISSQMRDTMSIFTIHNRCLLKD